MCCPPQPCRVKDIGAFRSNEDLIIALKSIQNRSSGTILPSNVIDDINPYLLEPSNLSEDIWYIVRLEIPKQTEVGFWKVKGDPCQIYSDSLVIGWRTTLEFYIGQSPNDHRTDWMMQEYSISYKDSSKVKHKCSLCRAFLTNREGEKPKTVEHQNNDETKGQNTQLHDEDNEFGTPYMSKNQADMERYNEMPFQQGEDLLQAKCFADGDYLELVDLLDPLDPQLPSSSSSENSSCVFKVSDLYFDPVALLQELECEVESGQTMPSN